jgi:hypothetical protein
MILFRLRYRPVTVFGSPLLTVTIFGQFKKRQWLINFSEQRDIHFFSVEKVF